MGYGIWPKGFRRRKASLSRARPLVHLYEAYCRHQGFLDAAAASGTLDYVAPVETSSSATKTLNLPQDDSELNTSNPEACSYQTHLATTPILHKACEAYLQNS